jgi:transmembrane sensor
VKELLLASRVQQATHAIDPERRIDVEELIVRAKANANVLPLDTRGALSAQKLKPAHHRRWIARAAATIAALTLLAWFAHSRFNDESLYATERGEQRMFKLDDGSVVFLNTQSRAQVRYSETSRDIYLNQGQALFQVEHDAARPFRVHAASVIIQAIGTQFDVRLDSDRATVSVVEGSVQVSMSSSAEPAGEATRITAGEGATVEAGGRIERAKTMDTKTATAWRQQRLIFHDTPLREIAAEFNRYNTEPRLHVAGDALSARRFDGSFNALRPESFLTYLSQEQGLNFERHGNEVVIRER